MFHCISLCIVVCIQHIFWYSGVLNAYVLSITVVVHGIMVYGRVRRAHTCYSMYYSVGWRSEQYVVAYTVYNVACCT